MKKVIYFPLVLSKSWLPGFDPAAPKEPLHTEMRTVRRKTGETHQQAYHVKTEAQKKRDPQGPGADLTLMTMMQRFSTEEAARAYFEKIRWPNGPVCPHCGNVRAYKLTVGRNTRPGMRKCEQCRKTFTVTVGTVMEDSHLPLNKKPALTGGDFLKAAMMKLRLKAKTPE